MATNVIDGSAEAPAREALDAFRTDLTMSREKWSLYMDEPGFVATLTKVLAGPGPAAIDALRRHAVILMKPEAWIEQRFADVSRFLDRNGFEIVQSFPCQISPLMAREIWRYQWNIAPVERVEVSELILSLGPSYGFFLRDARPECDTPASVRLARLKGPAKPERQKPGHLRYELRAPNRIVSLVHIPDEPADVIRDLSIMLGRREVVELLSAVAYDPLPVLSVDPAKLVVSRVEDVASMTPMLDRFDDLSQRTELIERAVRDYRAPEGHYRIPRSLWRHLLDLCGDIAQLPTLGTKRVQPLADIAQ